MVFPSEMHFFMAVPQSLCSSDHGSTGFFPPQSCSHIAPADEGSGAAGGPGRVLHCL